VCVCWGGGEGGGVEVSVLIKYMVGIVYRYLGI
jgi:hypothetical protein